jgi:hypothetical protein
MIFSFCLACDLYLIIDSLYTGDLFGFRFDVSFLFLALDWSPQRNRSIIRDNLDILRVSRKRVVRCKGLPYVLSDRPVGLVLRLIPWRLGLIVTISNVAAGVCPARRFEKLVCPQTDFLNNQPSGPLKAAIA